MKILVLSLFLVSCIQTPTSKSKAALEAKIEDVKGKCQYTKDVSEGKAYPYPPRNVCMIYPYANEHCPCSHLKELKQRYKGYDKCSPKNPVKLEYCPRRVY